MISGSFAEKDLQLKAFYASLPPCVNDGSYEKQQSTMTAVYASSLLWGGFG